VRDLLYSLYEDGVITKCTLNRVRQHGRGSGKGQVIGSCELAHEIWGPIKCWEFLDLQSNLCLHKTTTVYFYAENQENEHSAGRFGQAGGRIPGTTLSGLKAQLGDKHGDFGNVRKSDLQYWGVLTDVLMQTKSSWV
jgi:hypothetical protein